MRYQITIVGKKEDRNFGSSDDLAIAGQLLAIAPFYHGEIVVIADTGFSNADGIPESKWVAIKRGR